MDQKDHDILIRLEEKVDGVGEDIQEVKKWENNHLEHHRKYMYFAFTTCVGLILTLAILIIKLT